MTDSDDGSTFVCASQRLEFLGQITDADSLGDGSVGMAETGMGRRHILFPAGVGEVLSVHGAHSTHADQPNCRLLFEGMIRRDIYRKHGWQQIEREEKTVEITGGTSAAS